MRNFPIYLSLLVGISAPLASHAAPKVKAVRSSDSVERRAILRALTSDLNHASKDHVKSTPFTLTSLDIQSGWALAGIRPLTHPALDPFKAVLHKTQGKWRIVTLGTNLHGAGKQLGVPQRLWKKWELNGY
jgi:hypothetical protein